MKQLVGTRKGKVDEKGLILLPLLNDETWHIEGDFVVISTTAGERLYAIRIPYDVTRIEAVEKTVTRAPAIENLLNKVGVETPNGVTVDKTA